MELFQSSILRKFHHGISIVEMCYQLCFLTKVDSPSVINWTVISTSELRHSTTVVYCRDRQALCTARFCHMGLLTTADTCWLLVYFRPNSTTATFILLMIIKHTHIGREVIFKVNLSSLANCPLDLSCDKCNIILVFLMPYLAPAWAISDCIISFLCLITRFLVIRRCFVLFTFCCQYQFCFS